MRKSQQYKRTRPYQIKKTGIKDENIDRQIRAIHRAMAEKILSRPELIEQINERLENNKDNGMLTYGQYISWFSILELIDQPEVFINAILEDTPKMRRLRRNTPLVGILTEEERQRALHRDALGEVTDIQNII
ncbi:hypothetical protein [Neptunicella sp. SCSIO 80796]|uniref:hypothetical protein n=1 Tax=Neptunicella plasticusilytica TaxID=3117012 RepID=UPI003A4D37FD